MQEDGAHPVRAKGVEGPPASTGVRALWIMAVNVCRDAVPDGAIEDGLPLP